MTTGEGFRRKHLVKYLIGIGTTILCLIIFFRQINFIEVLNVITTFKWIYLAFGVASLLIGHILRIIRWSIMLNATGASTTFVKCSAPFLGSIALNNVLPFRLGDVVRALVFPRSMGITKTTATSSLIVERLIDLVTILISLAIGFLEIKTIVIPPELKLWALSLAIISGMALSIGFLFSGALGGFFNNLAVGAKANNSIGLKKIFKTLSGLLHGFNVMLRPKVLLTTLAVSMLVWVGEAGLYYFVLLGSGMDSSPLVAFLIMGVATLSTIVPSAPGYVGPFHLAALTAISLVGGTMAQAGSYAVIVHLSLWLPTTLVGAIAIWIKPEIFRTARSNYV